MDGTNGNKRVAREYFPAFIAGDRAWWERNVRPDFRRHDPGLPYEVVGIAGLQHHHDVLLAGVPDVEVFDLFRLSGGQLAEHWAMVDSLSLLKQLGATTL